MMCHEQENTGFSDICSNIHLVDILQLKTMAVVDMNMISSSALLSSFLAPTTVAFPLTILFPTSTSNSSTTCWRKRKRRRILMSIRLHHPRSGKAFARTADGELEGVDAPDLRNNIYIAGEDKSKFSAAHGIRRRGVISMATLPFLLSYVPRGSDAFAEQIDTREMSIICSEIRKVLSKFKAAGMLRLAFHDAGTFDLNEQKGGMNGSIIYELDRPENAGLNRSIKVLEKVKSEVDKVLQVSWADLIAIAGSVAVSVCKGPIIPVDVGRIDTSYPDPPGKLPLESLDASGLKTCFLEKGFSTQELVALSGAHTLGNKGFGNPFLFDNSYFKILMEKPWASPDGMSSMIGLPSDRALVEDDECLRWIMVYAGDQVRFFDDFRNAYKKLVNSGASWEIEEFDHFVGPATS